MFRRALVLLVVPSLLACKAREGERCLCGDDCRDGLVCAVGEGAPLEDGECAPSGQANAGTCIDEDAVQDGGGGTGIDEPMREDMALSKRDFEPTPPMGGTETGTGTTGSGTSGSGTTGPGTTGSGTTGSGTTGPGTTGPGTSSATTTSSGSATSGAATSGTTP